MPVPTSSQTRTLNKSSPKTNPQKFKKEWVKDYSWIENRDGKTICKVCDIKLSINKCHLKRHDRSGVHVRAVNALQGQIKINEQSEHNRKKDKIKLQS